MARHEGDFKPATGEPLSIGELLQLLDSNARPQPLERDDARARYLSSSEGWRDAGRKLGGAFAETGLRLSDDQPK